ncbi:MAG: response regulator [Chloroflexota bacterium]
METKPLAFVIEDYEDQMIVFRTALELAGYEIETISDGTVAQKRLAESLPDLIVLDLHIPGVPGDALLKQIRADPRLAKTRVMVATADALLAEELHDQADLVLLKPVSFAQLRQLAERYLGQPRKAKG